MIDLINDFISAEEESMLLHNAAATTDWGKIKDRRVVHYGYEYNYSEFSIKEINQNIPTYMDEIIARIHATFPTNNPINQLTIQEYKPGVGIPPHVDVKEWGDVIYILSVGSDISMDLRGGAGGGGGGESEEIVLKRKSLLRLTGEHRYDMKHGIRERKTDVVDGVVVKRGVRLSYTMRSVC